MSSESAPKINYICSSLYDNYQEKMNSQVLGITAFILTFNEEIHIEKCINSLKSICQRIIIIDSYSTDNTVKISKALGAEVFQNKWENNHSKQINWALANCNINTQWTMRLDADEYLSDGLILELKSKIANLNQAIYGIQLNRMVIFKGKKIKFGGFYPIKLLRIWKTGFGISEERQMDEHIVLSKGEIAKFDNDLIDENLNPIHWWVTKHNNYARREAFDFLDSKYHLTKLEEVNEQKPAIFQARVKRYLKNEVYNKLPLGLRPLSYFIYRYFIKFGFLDGIKGSLFHFLQGFWYRLIVDINIYEAEKTANGNKSLLIDYIGTCWGININLEN